MTISSEVTKVAYSGDGSSTSFAVPFIFYGSIELEVIERDAATGAETVKTLTTHYTVTGGNGAVGSVVAVTPPAVGREWHIRRKTNRLQTSDYVDGDDFPAETLERNIDRAAARDQEQDETLSRALVIPKTDPAASLTVPARQQRAGKFLAFDVMGNVVATAVAPDGGSGGGSGGSGEAMALTDLGEVGGSVTFEGVASRAYRLALLDASCVVTINAPVDATVPLRRLLLFVEYRAVGQVLVWPGSVRWPDGIAPSGGYGAGVRDVFVLVSDDGGTTWLAGLTGSGYGA